MEIVDTKVLDLEVVFTYLERIMARHIEYVDHCTYLKGRRFPVTDKKDLNRYSELKMVSSKPFHPIFGPSMCRDLFYYHARGLNHHRELLDSNPLIGTHHSVYPEEITKHTDREHIIFGFLPRLTVTEIEEINKLLVPVEEMFVKVISEHPDSIYDICIETPYFTIKRGPDLGAYRYQEALDHENLKET